ncbi:MAG TPA: OmpH family outer membrane protein [Acidobacteriota bacterium]|nr:OmpH family outer membrane protein [Acidobacteriota bacterium]
MNPKTILRGLVLTAFLAALVTPLWAQQKIAFVNTLRVIGESAEGGQKIDAWEAFYEGKRQELDAEAQELQQLQQQYQQQQLSLNAETQAEMQRTIEEKSTALKRAQEDAQREAEQRRNRIIQEVGSKLQALLQEYGQSNNYAAIFLLNPESQVFVAQGVDITDQIIALYNEKHPVAAQGSPAGGSSR